MHYLRSILEIYDDPNEFEKYKMEEDSEGFNQVIIKDDNENVKNDEIEDIIEQAEDSFDYDPTMEDEEENNDFNNISQQYKDIYQIVDTNGVIKNPERNTFALRVYECFFCRMVSTEKTFANLN